jgi:hypothetical protein
MSGSNSTLLVCSLLILGLAFLFGRLRWSRIDVVDVYVLMVSIFFGGYTLVDAVVKDLSTVNPFLAALVLLLVVATVGIIWLMSRILPIRLQRALQIRYLMAQWLRVDGKVVVLLLGVTILLQLYSYQQFGLLASHDLLILLAGDLALSGITMPYWFTAASSLMIPLVFSTFIAVALKVFTSQARTRTYWMIVLISVVLVASLYGRRNIFYVVFVFCILWCLAKEKNLFSLRSGLLALTVLPILVVFSNIYQTYRAAAANPMNAAPNDPYISASRVYDAAVDIDATISTLQERMAMWQYNYLIIYEQIEHHGLDIPYGELLWQGFKNTIPSVLWAEKTVYDLDEMAAYMYGIPVIDYPTNNFAMAQADFGLLSLVLLPLALLLVFLSIALLIQATQRHPTLLWLISGPFLFHLLNIEADYADLFILYRNMLILIFVYLVTYLFIHLLRRTRLYKKKQRVLPRPVAKDTGWRN